MDPSTIVGQNVRRLRNVRGWSQEVLATRSDLHRTYVADVECGTRNVTVRILFQLPQALEVEPAALVTGTDPLASAPVAAVTLRQRAEELLERLKYWQAGHPHERWVLEVRVAVGKIPFGTTPVDADQLQSERSRRRELAAQVGGLLRKHPDFDRSMAEDVNRLLADYAAEPLG